MTHVYTTDLKKHHNRAEDENYKSKLMSEKYKSKKTKNQTQFTVFRPTSTKIFFIA